MVFLAGVASCLPGSPHLVLDVSLHRFHVNTVYCVPEHQALGEAASVVGGIFAAFWMFPLNFYVGDDGKNVRSEPSIKCICLSYISFIKKHVAVGVYCHGRKVGAGLSSQPGSGHTWSASGPFCPCVSSLSLEWLLLKQIPFAFFYQAVCTESFRTD